MCSNLVKPALFGLLLLTTLPASNTWAQANPAKPTATQKVNVKASDKAWKEQVRNQLAEFKSQNSKLAEKLLLLQGKVQTLGSKNRSEAQARTLGQCGHELDQISSRYLPAYRDISKLKSISKARSSQKTPALSPHEQMAAWVDLMSDTQKRLNQVETTLNSF